MKTRGILVGIVAALAVSAFLAPVASAQYRREGSSYLDLNDSETVKAFKSHVSTLSASMMEGRKAGSEGERMAAEYISEKLKEYGVDVLSGKDGDKFGIRQENGDTLTSRNVLGFIQGTDSKLYDHYIVIGARMDNLGTDTLTVNGQKVGRIRYGANGNASGVAMMLELARMLQTNRLMVRRSILLVAFGASSESYAGSWYFLNRSFSDVRNIDAMVNLDMLGTGENGFYAYTSSNADMNQIVAALAEELQPIRPTLTAQEPYPSDHRAFYSKEIPSIYFTTGRFPEYGTERDTQAIIDFDMMERELEYIYNYSIALCNGIQPLFNSEEAVRNAGARGGVIAYYDCDVRPTFFGSSDPKYFLSRWVYNYLKYPKDAVKDGIQGRVLVDFIIDEKGKVQDVKVVKGVDPLLDEEAVRVVSASPDWKPGQVDGKKVKSEMSLYIEFKLTKKGTFGLKKN